MQLELPSGSGAGSKYKVKSTKKFHYFTSFSNLFFEFTKLWGSPINDVMVLGEGEGQGLCCFSSKALVIMGEGEVKKLSKVA